MYRMNRKDVMCKEMSMKSEIINNENNLKNRLFPVINNGYIIIIKCFFILNQNQEYRNAKHIISGITKGLYPEIRNNRNMVILFSYTGNTGKQITDYPISMSGNNRNKSESVNYNQKYHIFV